MALHPESRYAILDPAVRWFLNLRAYVSLADAPLQIRHEDHSRKLLHQRAVASLP
jgi:hypothetical protein